MRIAVPAVAVLLAAFPAPALAEEGDAARVAEELNDPARQAQLAAMAEVMADVLLEMPVAPLMRAAATMAGEDPEYVDPDLRVRDIAGPEAEDAPRDFARRLPQMAAAMATMAAALETMLPEMRARLEDVVPPDYE